MHNTLSERSCRRGVSDHDAPIMKTNLRISHATNQEAVSKRFAPRLADLEPCTLCHQGQIRSRYIYISISHTRGPLLFRSPLSASSFLHIPPAASTLFSSNSNNSQPLTSLFISSGDLFIPLPNPSFQMPTQWIRWPEHWYHDEQHIGCIVPDCGFFTRSEKNTEQLRELQEHCFETLGAEHGLVQKMLRQSLCAIGDCRYINSHSARLAGVRYLFAHEKSGHSSEEMSHIYSFVRLAREGRIRIGGAGGVRQVLPDCEKLAFRRMMDKIKGLPDATIKLLYQRSGLHKPEEQTDEKMGKILTYDHLAKPGDDPPYWWPIRAEHFLWSIRPDSSNPADDEWNVIWTHLREEYADGCI